MKKIVGVRYRPGRKVYDFESGPFVLNIGQYVVVESEQGLAFAEVVIPPRNWDETLIPKPFKKIFRAASPQDIETWKKNQGIEKDARAYCLQCIDQLNLKMNLFTVECNFDNSKITFFFTSEGRVDFRQLVKILVKELRTRIEMRQVGIRQHAKICGGMGRCGREICCSSFLKKFEPVSIRMAKEQNMSLNPTKISGQCGRLMCCLNYENNVYKELQKEFPRLGSIVHTAKGRCRVIRHNVLQRRVGIRPEKGYDCEIDLDDIKHEDKT